MRDVLVFALGAIAGGVIAGMLIKPSDCCVRVAAGIRTEVGDQLGPAAVAVGDVVGFWKYGPGLLTALGVEP
jgi:hypothetical protein